MPTFHATHALLDPSRGVSDDVAVTTEGDRIAFVRDGTAPDVPSTKRRLMLPAFANAHDHARPLSMSSFGAAFLPLETWLPRSMVATPPDAYLAALAPLARAARAGCAAVMVHYTRPSGRLSPVDEAREVARASGDVGVRIAFAPALRDRNPVVYGDEAAILAGLDEPARSILRDTYCRPPASASDLVATTDAIADAIAGPMVDVQYGPAGVQWCSRELLELIARRSAETGRRVHMHLLETPYQRIWADRAFPHGIVAWLRDIGLLSPRLTLAHCIHARPDELDMIAEAGAAIVTNTSSNLHLRSGIARIADAYARGCRIAVGVDGLAFDEDDDMVRETRLAHALHAGLGFEPAFDRAGFLARTVEAGRAAAGAPGDGRLAPGAPADFVLLDHDRIDRDAIMDVDALDLFFARATAAHIETVVVAGRDIVRGGELVRVDLEAAEAELRALYRGQRDRFAELERSWPAIAAAIEGWYRDYAGCC